MLEDLASPNMYIHNKIQFLSDFQRFSCIQCTLKLILFFQNWPIEIKKNQVTIFRMTSDFFTITLECINFIAWLEALQIFMMIKIQKKFWKKVILKKLFHVENLTFLPPISQLVFRDEIWRHFRCKTRSLKKSQIFEISNYFGISFEFSHFWNVIVKKTFGNQNMFARDFIFDNF